MIVAEECRDQLFDKVGKWGGGGGWRWRYLTQGAASPDVGKFPYEGGSQVADDGRIKD